MFGKLITLLNELFSKLGLNERISGFLSETISVISLFLIAIIVYLIVIYIVKKTVYVFIKKTNSQRDDILLKNNVFSRLCLIIPAYIVRNFATSALPSYPVLASTIIIVTKIYEVFIYSSNKLALLLLFLSFSTIIIKIAVFVLDQIQFMLYNIIE